MCLVTASHNPRLVPVQGLAKPRTLDLGLLGPQPHVAVSPPHCLGPLLLLNPQNCVGGTCSPGGDL